VITADDDVNYLLRLALLIPITHSHLEVLHAGGRHMQAVERSGGCFPGNNKMLKKNLKAVGVGRGLLSLTAGEEKVTGGGQELV